jgi:hypothetical protein
MSDRKVKDIDPKSIAGLKEMFKGLDGDAAKEAINNVLDGLDGKEGGGFSVDELKDRLGREAGRAATRALNDPKRAAMIILKASGVLISIGIVIGWWVFRCTRC